MKLKFFLFFIFIILFSGCMNKKMIIPLSNEFNKHEAEYVLKKGNNTIKGNAFMRQLGGGIVTCAGYEVILLPVTKYSSERIQNLYNSTYKGYANYYRLNSIQFTPESLEYTDYEKKLQSNSDGRFTFENIPDGEYLVLAQVTWVAGNEIQGGCLMKRVSVHGGETQDIIMSY